MQISSDKSIDLVEVKSLNPRDDSNETFQLNIQRSYFQHLITFIW